MSLLRAGAGRPFDAAAAAPVAVDAVGSADVTNFPGGTSVNFNNLTVGAGANRALLAIFCFGNNASPPTSISVTWNGVGLTQIANTLVHDGTDIGIVMFGLANPASGNQTLAFSWTGTQAYSVDAISFTGVDQSTPFTNGVNASGVGTTQNPGTITSPVGDYAAAAFASTVTYSAVDPTQLFQDTGASFPVGAANYTAGTGTLALTTTTASSTRWAASGVNVKQG
mgnify:CR=1 FL=1